jgi:uncharacterized protein YutE (UPF0331/DUF86 family)
MGGDARDGSSDPARPRASSREQKVAARLREISRDRRALRNALDRFDDGPDFASAWSSEDPEEINRRDQVERPYERIVNHLQEIIDFCEAEEATRDASGPVEAGVGRWRRAALRGYLSHAQAERWQIIARGRHRLAHHYADLAARQGQEIFEGAQDLLDGLPKAISGLGRWIEALWPRARS